MNELVEIVGRDRQVLWAGKMVHLPRADDVIIIAGVEYCVCFAEHEIPAPGRLSGICRIKVVKGLMRIPDPS